MTEKLAAELGEVKSPGWFGMKMGDTVKSVHIVKVGEGFVVVEFSDSTRKPLYFKNVALDPELKSKTEK